MSEPSKRKRGRWILRALIFILAGLAVVLVVRLVLFRGPILAPEPVPSAILDMHCHVAGIGAGSSGCFVSEVMQDSYKFDIYLDSFSVSREDLETHGDQLVVERLAQQIAESELVSRAVVLAMDGAVTAMGELDPARTQVYIPNEFVASQVDRYEELLFGASIHPLRSDALERLDRVHQQGAVLIKWIPSIQFIDPSDPRIIPFYDRMKELGLPLLSHTGNEKSFLGAEDQLADPQRLRLPLERGVRVIAAHAGTQGENEEEDNFERLARLMEEFPELYTEESSLTQINKLGHLDRALQDPRLKGRMIHGSDYPLINTLLVSPYYFPLHLTSSQMREIAAIDNPFDRAVRLKLALGMPASVFERTAEVIGFEGPR